MTTDPPFSAEIISEREIGAFRNAVEFWRNASAQRGVDFEWIGPKRLAPNMVGIGNGEVRFSIRTASGGYEVIFAREREGAEDPTYYSRFDDAVKHVVRPLGTSFRRRTMRASWLSWRDAVAEGVVREDLDEWTARYSLKRDPSINCIIGSYDGDEFSPALTMTTDEFNEAMLTDPGIVPPGRR